MLVLEMLPSDERAAFRGDFFGDCERGAVNQFEIALSVDQAQFFPMRVISEGLDDVRSGAQEISMEVLDLFREIENDFGDVGSRLQVAPALQFKQVALGANHRAGREVIQQTKLHHCPALLRRVLHDRRPRGAR